MELLQGERCTLSIIGLISHTYLWKRRILTCAFISINRRLLFGEAEDKTPVNNEGHRSLIHQFGRENASFVFQANPGFILGTETYMCFCERTLVLLIIITMLMTL